MKKVAIILNLLFATMTLHSQSQFDFDGQVSFISSYSPNNDLDVFTGLRYIPEVNYKFQIDTFKAFDFEVSVNINGIYSFHPFDKYSSDGNLDPYRLWARYTGKQFELRAGLQKIEFGSAVILRPMQWFNQIDPRDPLQLTNGVYGLLGRYYFLNNANIWVWALYGNEKTRGFDIVQTNKRQPEFGTRIQYPVPSGELALSYHYRSADSRDQIFLPSFKTIPEHRVGIDGKWDVGVGLWFELSQIWKAENLGPFTNQTLANAGIDYTFGIGNGLNIIAEHMLFSSDEEAFKFKDNANITAATLAYPLGFFDNLSSVFFYSWKTQDFTFFLNYSHQFKHFNAYVMAYYNPDTQVGIQQNDLVYTFTGPGIRLMLVYNY